MDNRSCEKYINALLLSTSSEHDENKDSSTKTRKLIEAIVKKDASFGITCMDCAKHQDSMAGNFARAYFSSPHISEMKTSDEKPMVVLCHNVISSEKELEEALAHEIIHAYDHCVSEWDLTTCDQLACSEVRAAREAECLTSHGRGLGEFCNLFGIQGTPHGSFLENICANLRERCVKSTAKRSVDAVFPGKGHRCVESVFEACYNSKTVANTEKEPSP